VSFAKYIEAYFAVLLSYKELNHWLSRKARSLGLSILELQVLWLVTKSRGATLADLAATTAHSQKQLHPIIGALERDGIITSTYVGESRKRLIKATPEGRSLLAHLQDKAPGCPVVVRVNSEILNSFSLQAARLVSDFRQGGVCKTGISNCTEKGEKYGL